MMNIVPDQRTVTDLDSDREPTAAELALIEREMPVIVAEVELLDAQITTLDRSPSELDARRLRRAEHRLLTERRTLANTLRSTPGVTA